MSDGNGTAESQASLATGAGENAPADSAAPEVAPEVAPVTPGAGEAGEAKPAEEPGKEGDEGKPALTQESYKDLQLGKDAVVQENYLDMLREFALAKGISPEQAQAIADWQSASNSELVQEMLAHQQAQMREAQGKWEAELKKEAGFDALLADCRRGFQVGKEVPGFDDLVKVLDETGLGSHPSFVRYFAQVGKLLGEPSIVNGAVGGGKGGGKSAEEVLYGNMGK